MRNMSSLVVVAGAIASSLLVGTSQAGVVADWSFNGSGSTIASGSWTATVQGDAVNTASGLALGSNGYVSTTLPLQNLSGNSFTIEILAMSANPSAGYQQLVGADNDYDFYFGNHSGTGRLTYLGGNGLAAFNTPLTNVDFKADGQYHGYVFQYRTSDVNGEIHAYIDGTEVAANSTPGNAGLVDQNGSLFVFGNENGGANHFQGSFARVRISDSIVAPADFISVPEPASLAMLGSTLLLLTQRWRRA